jgi:hypothetical protein
MMCKERGCRSKTLNAQRSTSNVQFRKSFMLALLILILIDLTSDSDCPPPAREDFRSSPASTGLIIPQAAQENVPLSMLARLTL